MDSKDLAQYIEATDSISQPWLLLQLRLQKLKERRATMSPEAYTQAIAELCEDLMKLGEWWVGREAEVFGSKDQFDDTI
ncbi:MAG: hypothetical protein F6K14_22885 [Symploca sp. SIO2C1]|nr:hypothetical protein [Symploca sp. SIO2C1]